MFQYIDYAYVEIDTKKHEEKKVFISAGGELCFLLSLCSGCCCLLSLLSLLAVLSTAVAVAEGWRRLRVDD